MSNEERVISVHLETITCKDEGDGAGNAEPYLWTIFIKMGGDEISHTKDSVHLDGAPAYEFSRGSHGNLWGGDYDAGDEEPIPYHVGHFTGRVKPIHINAFGKHITIPGMAGLVTILLEEDNVTDAGAEDGHQALNNLVVTRVNQFIAGLDLSEIVSLATIKLVEEQGKTIEQCAMAVLQEKLDAFQKELVNDSTSVVVNAIENSQNIFENLWSLIDPDDFIGAKMHFYSVDQLLAAGMKIDIEDTFDKNDGKYVISGYFSVTPPLIPIGVLPDAERLEIDSVAMRYSRRKSSNYITHIGGRHEGTPWILPKHEGAVLEKNKSVAFYVAAPDGTETEVLAAEQDSGELYLRTCGNDTEEDNLLSLPALCFYRDE